MKELLGKSVNQIKQALENKEIKAQEIAQQFIAHIEHVDPKIKAFNTYTFDLAQNQAKAIDEKIAKGEKLPALAGIPLAIKDNICLTNYPTTCSSKILENFTPHYEAEVVRRLKDSGALIFGKTNLDEFAMGSSCENSAFKTTCNPWNEKMVPGGSSGGSAASVASGMATIALGSDTGGSIRQPASFCGIAGMKPTYGRVSRFGLVAFASSLDQIGPFGRCVEDLAWTMNVISGHDQKDSTCLNEPVPDFVSEMKKARPKLKIGIIKELLGQGIDDDVLKATEAAGKVLKDCDFELVEVSMPHFNLALPVYYIIATAEASSNLARFDGVKYGYRNREAADLLRMYLKTRQEGFGAEVKRRIMLGTYALSSGYYDAYYKKAQQVRRLIKNDFDQALEKVDVLACPTSPSVAFEIGSKTDDPLTMYLSDIATIPANLAGVPGISIPSGFSKGLPIGLQFMGKPLDDGLLLSVAYAYEQATNFHKELPPPLTGVAV